jgi:hypothetical protein
MLRIGTSPALSPFRLRRREFLQAGGAGLLGLTVPKLLQAETEVVSAPRTGKAKSVIFLFLFGGPSQLETFDMKPDAPSNLRGPFKPTACRTTGLVMCEHLPKMAAMSDKFCVIRSMSHDYNDHSGAAYCIQTGRRWHIPMGGGLNPTPKDWPAIGSVVEYWQQTHLRTKSELPNYAVVPNALGRLQEDGALRRPGEYASWLGRSYNPLTTKIDKRDLKDIPYFRDCTDEELNYQIDGLAPLAELQFDRVARRAALQTQLDEQRRLFEDNHDVTAFDRTRQRALELISSQKTRDALDIKKEPAKLRDAYGRHLFGQSALVARRLVEAGVRFVTVHYDTCDGYSWDSHDNSRDVEKYLLPSLDQTYAALITDLEERGMLDETLVVAMGELGRTPESNGRWGRAHLSGLFPAVLAGAGVRGGMVYGKSDKDAARVVDNPVTPEDLAATLYHALGIDPKHRIRMPDGRPAHLVDDGKPVLEIFG